jgi:uncharacterized spore protein YtfJ
LLSLLLGFFIFPVAAFTSANRTLETLLVNDTLIGQGFEDGFVLLTFTTLGFCFAAATGTVHAVLTRQISGAILATTAVAGQGSWATEVLPGCR